jgi:hypothetical protein
MYDFVTLFLYLRDPSCRMNEHKFNQQKRTPVHFPGIYLEAFPDRPISRLRRKIETCLSDEGIYGVVVIKIQNQAQVIHNKAQVLVTCIVQKPKYTGVSVLSNDTKEKKNIRATEDRNNGSPKKKRSKQCVTKSTENQLDNNNEGVIANSIVTVTLPTSVSVSNTQSLVERQCTSIRKEHSVQKILRLSRKDSS